MLLFCRNMFLPAVARADGRTVISSIYAKRLLNLHPVKSAVIWQY